MFPNVNKKGAAMRAIYKKLMVLLVLVAAQTIVPAWSGEGTTTRAMVEKSLRDMRDAWTNYPSKTQDQVRTTLMQDLNQTFTREIATAEIPPNENLQKVYAVYMNNLDRGFETLALATMKPQLTTYQKNCSIAFKREVMACSDYSKERTTQECFMLLLNMFEQAKERFPKKDYATARQEIISTVNQILTTMLQAAKVPEKGPSASEQHDENNKLIRMKFPINVATLVELNTAFKTSLETYAKQVQTRAARR